MSVSNVTTSIRQRVEQANQPGSRAGTIVRHAAIGGVIGAVGGAALSLTALPFIGALSAPLAAAIGGAAGLVIGGIVGIFRSRNDGPRVGAGIIQAAPPAPGTSRGGLPPAPPLR